jgi:hypothetical protein
MPLHSKHVPGRVNGFNRFDDTIGGTGDGSQTTPQVFHTLVMQRVDDQLVGVDNIVKARTRLDPGSVVTGEGSAGKVLRMVGKVLMKCAPKRNVDDLETTTDSEQRDAASCGLAYQSDLKEISLGANPVQRVCTRLLTVSIWIDIAPTGKQQSVEALKEFRDINRIAVGQDNRKCTGGSERPNVQVVETGEPLFSVVLRLGDCSLCRHSNHWLHKEPVGRSDKVLSIGETLEARRPPRDEPDPAPVSWRLRGCGDRSLLRRHTDATIHTDRLTVHVGMGDQQVREIGVLRRRAKTLREQHLLT